jgi:hypothetical protein
MAEIKDKNRRRALTGKSRQPATRKRIGRNTLLGQQGINLIERLALAMGFVWHPTNLDAGIDGYIEIRDAATEEVSNCIIQVQSKATDGYFEAETTSNFSFTCNPRDLHYWLNGNAPVVLICSRPRTGEAYWVSVKDYFKDKPQRTTRIFFDKTHNRLSAASTSDLFHLAVPRDSGIYLGALPKNESIHSNIIPVSYPPSVYVASTECRRAWQIYKILKASGHTTPGEWILRSKTIISFHDLNDRLWTGCCEQGTVEEHATSYWAESADQSFQHAFIELAKRALESQLRKYGVIYNPEWDIYYFAPTRDFSDRYWEYQSRRDRTGRWVFKRFETDGKRFLYFRHSAFEAHFRYYDQRWFVEVMPSYVFTWNGFQKSYLSAASMSGIKRLEKQEAVHGQVVMWADLLRQSWQSGMFDRPSLLQFGQPLRFDLDVGLDDQAWLRKEDAAVPDVERESNEQLF